jgi:cell division protease FtsH
LIGKRPFEKPTTYEAFTQKEEDIKEDDELPKDQKDNSPSDSSSDTMDSESKPDEKSTDADGMAVPASESEEPTKSKV